MIDKLKQDLAMVAQRCPSGALVATADFSGYLVNDLLPFLGNIVEEIEAQDGVIEDLVRGTSEVLHTDSAEKLAALIVTGTALASELRTRAGNDRRLLELVKTWQTQAAEATALIEDVTIPDEEEDDEEGEEGEEEGDETPVTPGAAGDTQ